MFLDLKRKILIFLLLILSLRSVIGRSEVNERIANELKKAVATNNPSRLRELIRDIPNFKLVHLGLPSLAVLDENPEVLKVLLEAQADVDERDPQYRVTALHLAAYYNEIEMCKLLMHSGANQFLKNGALQTPVEVAESRGSKECLSELNK